MQVSCLERKLDMVAGDRGTHLTRDLRLSVSTVIFYVMRIHTEQTSSTRCRVLGLSIVAFIT